MTPHQAPSPDRRTARQVVVVLLGLSVLLISACGSSTNTNPTSPAIGKSAKEVTTIDGAQISADPTLHAMLPADVANTVTVGEDPSEPPWGYFASPGSKQFTGAEYDLGQAIAAKLGTTFNVADQPFAGLIPAILAGRYAVGLSNLGDRKEREESLDFVDYLLDGDGLLVAKGNPKHINSLTTACGHTLAMTAGSTFLTYAQSHNKSSCGSNPYKVVALPSDAETFLAIKSGKADATLTDLAEAAYVARTSDGGRTLEPAIDPKAPQGYAVAWIGMAVAKKYRPLAEAMVAAEADLVKTGAERAILAHYGLQTFAGTAPKLNACATAGRGC